MSARRRKLPLLALGLLAAALAGCGDSTDPFAMFAGGSIIELEGVVHIAGSTRGDFVPRKLVATLTMPIDEISLGSLLNEALPGSLVTLASAAPNQALIEVPEGMSLAAAASAVGAVQGIGDLEPQFLPGATASLTLRSPTGGPLYELPVMTRLTARDQSDLRQSARAWVVTVRGRTAPGTDLGPTSLFEVVAVERGQPYTLTLLGGFERLGPNQDCPVVRLDDGRLVELTGSQGVAMASTVTPGAAVRVNALDAGLSANACSGGLQVQVIDFGPR